MKIKRKKNLSIEQLIAAVRTGELPEGDYFNTLGDHVSVDEFGVKFESTHIVLFEDLFTVAVEEEVTEDTEFKTLVATSLKQFHEYEGSVTQFHFTTISQLRSHCESRGERIREIHALIDGRLQLVWQREEG